MAPKDSVVLAHLAAFSWFVKHGEVTLTQGLAFCLQKDDAAATALVKLLRTRTELGVDDLPTPTRWKAESSDADRMRVDVAGFASLGQVSAPVVQVEAKVSAMLTPGQLPTYVASQRADLTRAAFRCGVLAVVVPEARIREVIKIVEASLGPFLVASPGGAWRLAGEPPISVTIVSWDDAFEAMQKAATSSAGDLEQLLGACRALQGANVLAITAADMAGAWRSRKDDLRLVVNRITRGAAAELSLEPLPWQPRSSAGTEGGFRYIGAPGEPNLCVGMRVDETDPPLWVRWHRETTDIELVRPRLEAAGYKPVSHEAHLWVPLAVEPATGGAGRQIVSLTSQIVRLYRTAAALPDAG